MLIGYARVSTEDQTLSVQVKNLREAGCTVIFKEKISGAIRKRPELQKLLKKVKKGDILVVHRLDRLARSTQHLLEITEYLRTKDTGLRSLSEPWADTTSAAGRMILTVFAGIAEFERALIRERTAEGRKLARERGIHMGRPAKLKPHEAETACKLIMEKQVAVSEVAMKYGVHRTTIYRLVAAAQRTKHAKH
jgi:DNA invertase Pin-like site-specific DNA recombinase